MGKVSEAAVQPLATTLSAEAEAAVRAAIMRALEVIAPRTRPVLDAHSVALRDPDPAVRAAVRQFLEGPVG